MSTALVWFRRDLRVHDHPPLRAALDQFERVVPVFVLDPRLLDGRFESEYRASFLFDCLKDLRERLQERGGNLVVLTGTPEQELPRLAHEHQATAVFFASDVSPFAMNRDKRTEEALRQAGIEPRRTPGNFIADIGKLKPYGVFSPFWRAWKELPRRDVHGAPRKITTPPGLTVGTVPTATRRGDQRGGETAGRKAMLAFDPNTYDEARVRLDRQTSRLSAYLHFGCISARELETRHSGKYARQLAWRDFYAHVLLHNPRNTHHAYQEDYDALEWEGTDEHFDAWREGRTGYPVVDAGMRQLAETGWMHNRARLITASFLVKDLHIDWRRGEQHFMRYLIDGDVAQNNGNWQWISSVGVDPAPLYRRFYNPSLQQARHDPDGVYVNTWAPDSQTITPIVDHATERKRTLAAYGRARDT
ncbi:deoxyribodipyrimidine photo-lyase [Solirubrobacter sp. CPCC 204708]|uniref:DNA photolyase family protein n=1 Tax=Solirubrobacter deserti TaxID=2282478 RepID=A0ABT4RNS2_9ACTN|nr:deoxyribodipyrimidine photo-lyase [Solirubrobacter deserti]MBE2319203.1 deoxyribodipyrimidine photo-lyase [Solirubrobacter deserti]MDA0140209.1 DNA photolyase family protein [Solirubrobacter deserti]